VIQYLGYVYEKICSAIQLNEWTQRRGLQWERDFKGVWEADMQEVVMTSMILSSVQVLPQVPHGLNTMGYTFFSQKSPRFPTGLFKICLSWDWSNSRG
jgi:hypothetical protein